MRPSVSPFLRALVPWRHMGWLICHYGSSLVTTCHPTYLGFGPAQILPCAIHCEPQILPRAQNHCPNQSCHFVIFCHAPCTIRSFLVTHFSPLQNYENNKTKHYVAKVLKYNISQRPKGSLKYTLLPPVLNIFCCRLVTIKVTTTIEIVAY